MDGLDAQTLRELLPSLAPTIELIAAHLALPPPVLYVHAPSSTALAPLLIRALAPSHELCVHLDCVELHEPRLIYDRALNGLAAWDVGYEERYGGVPNWDGREASARKRGRWDPEERPLNDTAKGAVGVHADESMSTFIAALQRVFTLDAEDTEPRPRFLIFDHTERLAHLHDGTIGAAIAAHINEGAFFAALSRLGEFVRAPTGGAPDRRRLAGRSCPYLSRTSSRASWRRRWARRAKGRS